MALNQKGNDSPRRDVYALIDISSSTEPIIRIIRQRLKDMLISYSHKTSDLQNTYLTVILFNHGFKILMDHVQLNRFDAKKYNSKITKIRACGATDPVRPLTLALNDGLTRCALERASGNPVCAPIILFWGDGEPDAGERRTAKGYRSNTSEQEALTEAFDQLAQRVRRLTEQEQIHFLAYVFSNLNYEPELTAIEKLTDSPTVIKSIVKPPFPIPMHLPRTLLPEWKANSPAELISRFTTE